MSAKRQAASKVYAEKRSAFLAAHPKCEACRFITGSCAINSQGVDMLANKSRDVHHTAGRSGTNYLDHTTWLAVCRRCHDWIHNNPALAREFGLLK